MKIAFLGKGGSGKTTLSASFIDYLSRTRAHVLAIDADQNVHLGRQLGFPDAPLELGNRFGEIAEALRGTRTDLGGKAIIGTTPPGAGSNLITINPDDKFLKHFGTKHRNISLLTTGTYSQEDAGHNCYHGKLEATTLVMSHLLDGPEDYVVADCVAGTDLIGSALYFQYDALVFVVEPTRKSLGVLKDFVQLHTDDRQRILVIGNKVEDDTDREYVASGVAALSHPLVSVLGFVASSDAVIEDQRTDNGAALPEVTVWPQLVEFLSTLTRNDEKYFNEVQAAHRVRASKWYNDFYGVDLSEGLDGYAQYAAARRGH